MKITDKEIDDLAKEYAKEKSSSEVFRTAHENDFKAGFSKALSLFAVMPSVCNCGQGYHNYGSTWICPICGNSFIEKQTEA